MAKPIYQLQIALRGIKPKIWRRLLIDSDVKLRGLHQIIQVSMGWYNSHLHHFIKDGAFYTVKFDHGDDYWESFNNIDYSKIKVSDLLKKEKDKMVYEYDFGDGWEHDVILEKIDPESDCKALPICIKGANNCPPEDCGGEWGYANMLEILKDPKHVEYEEMIEWLGGGYDPGEFDMEIVNEMLQEEDYGCIELFD